MNDKKYFLTTTLPYANSVPHVGHALEFIQASAIKRYLMSTGSEVFLNVGVDEHGEKMFNAGGGNSGLDVLKYCDEMAAKWIDFCFRFDIEFDKFYRTTSLEHQDNVQRYWQQLVENGDIYMAPYVGRYCSGCESFKTSVELVDGICPDHPTTPITGVSEMNYFFRLSKYAKTLANGYNLADHLITRIYPKTKRTELLNIIENAIDGSKDISISRSAEKVSWGIPVPFDKSQTIYVWFEALLNYLFSCGETEWNESTIIQICGPDNIRFQGFWWQAMLMAAGCKTTDHLIVHGTVLDKNGNKMSKSLMNVLDPVELLDKHGLSSVRYYALKGLNTFENSGWAEEDQVKLYNADLANNYGNLLARTMHLMTAHESMPRTKPHGEFEILINRSKEVYGEFMSRYDLRLALESTMALLSEGNMIMNRDRPWEPDNERRKEILSGLWWILSEATDQLSIALSAMDINNAKESLRSRAKIILFPKK